MTQITYNYPAMLSHVAEMNGYTAALQTVGSDIASEQASLANAWVGTTGDDYQSWQAHWNQQLQDLVMAYHAMAQAHEENIMTMSARDQVEGAKWA